MVFSGDIIDKNLQNRRNWKPLRKEKVCIICGRDQQVSSSTWDPWWQQLFSWGTETLWEKLPFSWDTVTLVFQINPLFIECFWSRNLAIIFLGLNIRFLLIIIHVGCFFLHTEILGSLCWNYMDVARNGILFCLLDWCPQLVRWSRLSRYIEVRLSQMIFPTILNNVLNEWPRIYLKLSCSCVNHCIIVNCSSMYPHLTASIYLFSIRFNISYQLPHTNILKLSSQASVGKSAD